MKKKKFNTYFLDNSSIINNLRKNTSHYNYFILRSTSTVFLKSNVFESVRRLISRKVKKKMKYTLYKKSSKIASTGKPLKVRMGKGKGTFKF